MNAGDARVPLPGVLAIVLRIDEVMGDALDVLSYTFNHLRGNVPCRLRTGSFETGQNPICPET